MILPLWSCSCPYAVAGMGPHYAEYRDQSQISVSHYYANYGYKYANHVTVPQHNTQLNLAASRPPPGHRRPAGPHPRKLAGNPSWRGVILRAIEASGAGQCWGSRTRRAFGKRTGCIWTTWASFYGLLASLRGQLFSDDDFAEIYCPDNGRDSVPPSLLATALLLQTYDKVSDAEAKARADFDIRWKVALGIEIEDRPFAKSTLQMFRAQLILHDKVREVFESSLRLARQSGYLKKRGMRVALDTTYILGKDTYNLLADGMSNCCGLAAVAKIAVGEWAEAQGYERYFGSSIKGEATIGSDRKLLAEIVADADRLLALARQAWVELPEDSAQRQSIVDGAELLGQLLLQDERKSGDVDADADDGVSVKDGVSKDRMPSVHDPELRHGHKSSRRRFNGHKAAIVVDTDSQLITAVDARQRSRQSGTNWWRPAKRVPARWWRKPWAMRPMGTAGPARPSDGGSWWPKCRDGPTGNTFPSMTFTLTWPRAVAPVRRDSYPRHRKRTDGAGRVYRSLPVRRGGMWGTTALVHRGQRQEGTAGADPSPGRHATAGPGLAAKRLPTTSIEPGSGAQIGPPGHPFRYKRGGHGGQSHPGGGQNRAVGQYRRRRSRPPRRPQ